MSNLLQSPNINYQPTGFKAGGLNVNGYGNVTEGDLRASQVSGLSDSASNSADEYGALRDTVAPGFNSLLSSRLDQINDSARSAIGDLRQNLSSRRILGSSFGNDTITRANAEFSRQRDQATADNFLKSLDASQQLLGKETAMRRQQFQDALDELNLEAGIGQKVSGTANQLLAANAQAQAKLDQATNFQNLGLISSLFGTAMGKIPSGGLGGGGGGISSGQQSFWNAGMVGPV